MWSTTLCVRKLERRVTRHVLIGSIIGRILRQFDDKARVSDFTTALQAFREELDRGIDIQGVQYLRDIAQGQSELRLGMKGDEALKGLLAISC